MPLNRFQLDILIRERDQLAADLEELAAYRERGEAVTVTHAEVAILEARLKALVKVTGGRPLRPPTVH